MARRRSSRIRARSTKQTQKTDGQEEVATAQLETVVEHEDTLDNAIVEVNNSNTSVETPHSPPATSAVIVISSSPTVHTPNSAAQIDPPMEEMHPSKMQHSSTKKPQASTPKALLKTPTSAERIRPPNAEMHPAKAHQSTVKKVDSGLRLGFSDINPDSDVKADVSFLQNTPSKAMVRLDDAWTRKSAGFEFSFGQNGEGMNEEANKVMASVREEAIKIKEKMRLQGNDLEDKDSDSEHTVNISTRKIAKPRGRFSNAHMMEFRKMDSIANHPSAFRARPGIFQPVIEHEPKKSLKRTRSNAGISEDDNDHSKTPKKRNSLTGSSAGPASAKRIKHRENDDTSTERPISRDRTGSSNKGKEAIRDAGLKTPNGKRVVTGIPRSKSSNLLAHLTTPTKASLARIAATKTPKTTMIGKIARSKTESMISSPLAAPRTEYRNKSTSRTPKLTEIKSILRKPHRLFSDDPQKIAAGTHIPLPKSPSRDKLLSNLPRAPTHQPTSPLKKVLFSADANEIVEAQASPSPVKPSTSHVHFSSPLKESDVVYPVLPTTCPPKALYSNARERSEEDEGGPNEFTFRSNRTISFGPIKKAVSPTIRRVRPSGIPTSMSSAPFEFVPAVPHGISNKKRKRSSENDVEESDLENVPPSNFTSNFTTNPFVSNCEEQGKKRQKLRGDAGNPSPIKRRPRALTKGSSSSPMKARTGRGVLSMSRLNLLAKPKQRG